MLDLESLRIIRREAPEQRRFSFVGVRLSPVDRSPEFWLPQGFQAFPSGDFDRTVRLFFDLFRVMRTFVETRGLRPDQRADKRDPLQLGGGGLNFALDTDTPILTFAKLNVLEGLLDSFDELVLSAIISKDSLRTPEGLDEVHKHLHNAVYLEDDRIHFESLPATRYEIFSGPTQLVRLFCFIYTELVRQIYGPERIARDVATNAASFKEEHLPDTAGLFVEGSFKTTLQVLKEVLERVDRTTPYKDDDYWQVFNAVETFLYGDVADRADHDGIVWGISDFHPIWEEMCHAYTVQAFEETGDRKVIFAHTEQGSNSRIGRAAVVNHLGHEYPFRLEMDGRRRNLLPDLVAQSVDNVEARRIRFRKMLVVTRPPGDLPVPAQISVRASVHLTPTAEGWLATLKRNLSKRGWHTISSGKNQLVVRKIPWKLFSQVYEALETKFVGPPERPTVFILDFKYHHPNEYCGTSLPPKILSDILKQNAYELAYQLYHEEHVGGECRIRSQFVIPLYAPTRTEPIFLDEDMPEEMGQASPCADLVSTGIELWALPFHAVTDAYIRRLS